LSPTEQQAFLGRRKPGSAARRGGEEGSLRPRAPLPFKHLRVMTPGGLFNGGIAPLVPYDRSYQGERNSLGPADGYYGDAVADAHPDSGARWGDESTLRGNSCRVSKSADGPEPRPKGGA